MTPPVRDREQAITAVLAITQAEPQGHRGQRLGRHGAERIVDALLPRLDSEHPEPLLRAVADAIEEECPDAMVLADVALGALRKLDALLGNCARCDAELPGEHHLQELPCIYVDEGRLLCGDCGRLFSLYAHSCFIGQWIQERERWPLARDGHYPDGNDPTSDPTRAANPNADGGSA